MAMTDDVVKDLKGRIDKTLEDLKRELAKIRTGRAIARHARRRPGRLLRHAHPAERRGQRSPSPSPG